MTSDQSAIYRQRLLNVARALREAPLPKAFCMQFWTYDDSRLERGFPCGTPACALGHYAARADLQDEFFINHRGRLDTIERDELPIRLAVKHFGLTEAETDRLFEMWGCGGATTPIEAAEYIEAFVATKYPEKLT
jgi:hypothetical protein